MRKFTKQQYDTLPHVIMSSDEEWNPRAYDNHIDPKGTPFQAANPEHPHLLPYDDCNALGEYVGQTSISTSILDPMYLKVQRIA